MEPNNNNPQSGNQNLDKLEQDLEKLTKEAGATTQPTPDVSTQPVQPLTTQPTEVSPAPVVENIVTSQPIETPPAPPNVPVESGKKGSSLMTIAMTLLIIAVLVAVGYVAYTKFMVPNPTPTTVPVVTEKRSPEITPQASDSAVPDLTNWRQITNKYWSFKAPVNLYYILCIPAEDSIMFDSSITSDQKIECDFDGVKLISISRLTSIYSIPINPSVIPTTDPNSPVGDASNLYTLVSDKKNVLIDGKTATYQKEIQHGGQGEGTYLKAYVVNGTITYIFSLSDISQKQTFDQLLSTFKFIDSTSSATPQ